LYLSKENHLGEKQEPLAHFINLRIDLVSDRNTFYKSKVSRRGTSHLIPNMPDLQVEEKHVSLQGKSTKFEAGATCALFPCED
jgi:hypothetical protein